MKTIRTIIILVILFAAGSFVYIYSGTYNIAASKPHTGITEWVLEKTKERSVKFHSRDITPPRLDGESLIKEGFNHYDSMCSGCHGAPGSEPAEGFNPAPPALAEEAGKYSPAELFWIIKNGIKMTGMPEFGSTHSDDELWGVVAFTAKLPDISPEQYNIMREESENSQQQHNHDHGQTSKTETADRNGNENPNENGEREVRVHSDGSEHQH